MALTVATNTGALMAQAAASSVNKEMELSMERLSTGKRLNAASDDAAGVAIASRLTAEIRGTNQAIRNAMDGQALLDTAEGAHIEIENILQRMRELSVQSANDTNDANDRANLQLEIDQLSTEIDRIASTTTWAGQNLVDGTGSFAFQVGSKTTSSDTITTTINAMNSAGIGIGASTTANSANGATLTEVGSNLLQVGGTPKAGDVYHFTVGSTDMAVRLDNVGNTPVVVVPSSAAANGASVSMSGNALTVGANATGSNDTINVNVNGTDVQVTMTAGQTTAQGASAIKAAIEAHSDFASMGVSVAVDASNTAVLNFSPATAYSKSLDGGTTFTSQTALAKNGIDAVSSAIAATINAQTSGGSGTLYGLSATAASDGSISLSQDVNITASSVTTGGTATFTFGSMTLTKKISFTGLTSNGTAALSDLAAASSNTVNVLAAKLATAAEIDTAIVASDGLSIAITYTDVKGTEFSAVDTASTPVTVSIAQTNITDGTTADASRASVSSDGTTLTLNPVSYDNAGEQVKFTINGEDFTVTQSATDKYDLNQAGMMDKIQDLLDASTKNGGVSFTVAANANTATKIDITATAATTGLATAISADAAAGTTTTTGLSVTTSSGASAAIVAIDAAITTVNSQRATLGAVSNRLDSTVNNLTNISSNLQAGRGRIEDADFAAETTALAKSQILQQASTAMLAQANASKQNVLSLLQG